jgi:hypothetical protein
MLGISERRFGDEMMPTEANVDAQQTPQTLNATATGVSPEEMRAAFEVAAVNINKTLLTLTPVTARLSFLEVSPSGDPAGRAAVTMTIGDLIQLRDLIVNALGAAGIKQVPVGEPAHG